YDYMHVSTPLPYKSIDFSDPNRISEPGAPHFPLYLFQELLRIGHLGPKGPLCCADRITSNEIIDPNTDGVDGPDLSWFACPPGARSGGTASFESSFTTRPGVQLTATPSSDTGCVQFTASFQKAMTPFAPPARNCVTPWGQLNS